MLLLISVFSILQLFIQCCLNPHSAEIHTSSDFKVQTLIFFSELLLLFWEQIKHVSRVAQTLFHRQIISLSAASAQTSLLNVFSLYYVLYLLLCENNLTPVSYPGCFSEDVCPPWNWSKSCRLLLEEEVNLPSRRRFFRGPLQTDAHENMRTIMDQQSLQMCWCLCSWLASWLMLHCYGWYFCMAVPHFDTLHCPIHK